MGKTVELLEDRILSGRLQAGDVASYAHALQQQYPGRFAFTSILNSFTRVGSERFGATVQEIESFLRLNMNDSQPPIIILPIALAATSWLPFAEDHVTLLIIDKKNRMIKYYDPKGGDLRQEQRELAIVPRGGMTGEELLGKVWRQTSGYLYDCYEPKGFWASVLGWFFGLGRRLSSHQGAFDRSSCGIFVSRAIQCYVKNDSSFEAVEQPLPSGFSIKKERAEIANVVREYRTRQNEAGNPIEMAARRTPSVLHGSTSSFDTSFEPGKPDNNRLLLSSSPKNTK